MPGALLRTLSVMSCTHRIRHPTARPRRILLSEATVPPRAAPMVDHAGYRDQGAETGQQQCVDGSRDEPQHDSADDRNGGRNEREGRTTRRRPGIGQRQRFVVRYRIPRRRIHVSAGSGVGVLTEIGDPAGSEER